MSHLGYTHSLAILAFDHRNTLLKLFGVSGREPTEAEFAQLQRLKMIIFKAFDRAVRNGNVPKDEAGILVDEYSGSDVIRAAKEMGYILAVPAEKSGVDEFQFEHGSDFKGHIEKVNPSFVKILVRYNPEDDSSKNARQRERLRMLSEYCHETNRRFLFELLVPATENQLARVGNDKNRFDTEMRVELTIRAISEFQEDGIEPDIWKLEGYTETAQYQALEQQIHSSPERADVGLVILGRGQNEAAVKTWITAGKGVRGVVGFAVGRTLFMEPLEGVLAGKVSEEDAITIISQRYSDLYQIFSE